MNLLKLLFFVPLFLLTFSTAQSQSIFREGYIIKNDGQILNGSLKYTLNQGTPDLCVFRFFDIAVEVKYRPGEIKEFGYFSGNRYLSKIIDGKSVFCEVIISGMINLYSARSTYFVEKGTSGLTKLKEGGINYNDLKGIESFKNLTSFLIFLTEGKVSDIKEPVSLRDDLPVIIAEYNKKSGEQNVVYNRNYSEQKIIKRSFYKDEKVNKIGIYAGTNIYILKLSPQKGMYINSSKSYSTVFGGISFERVISRKMNNLTFATDLLYLKHDFYTYYEKTSNSIISREDTFYEFTGIKIPLQLHYNLSSGKFVPFLRAGVSFTGILNSNYFHVAEIEYTNHAIYTSEDRKLKFKNYEIGLLCGAGMKMNIKGLFTVNILTRFEYGPGIFNISKYDLKQKSIQYSLLMGISF